MMMDSEEEEEQTALVCDNGKFKPFGFIEGISKRFQRENILYRWTDVYPCRLN